MKRAIGGSILFLFYSIYFLSCKWVNPTAPIDSVLFVSASPMTIASGGMTSVVTVIGYDALGSPLKDRTIVFFTTDLGSIDPLVEIKNGRATAVFKSGSQSGIAHIYVSSGKATVSPSPLEITVGTSALAKLTIRANPASLPPGGGRSQIIVDAQDKNGNGLSSIPVILSTDAGKLDSGGNTLYSNEFGRVEDWLTTTTEAKVTATSGGISAEVKITIGKNQPPEAKFEFSPSSPKINERVYFNASASNDPDGTIVSYAWDFGNGLTGTGVQTSCQYSAAGSYTVVLVVKDNQGANGSTAKQVQVQANTPPTASFTFSPVEPKVNETVYLNASASNDPDGTIVRYDWDFGNGATGTGVQTTCLYAAAGKYTITLIVKDNAGAAGTSSREITIKATVTESLYSDPQNFKDSIGWDPKRRPRRE